MKDHLIRSSGPGSDANERFNGPRNGDGYPRATGEMWSNGTEPVMSIKRRVRIRRVCA